MTEQSDVRRKAKRRQATANVIADATLTAASVLAVKADHGPGWAQVMTGLLTWWTLGAASADARGRSRRL